VLLQGVLFRSSFGCVGFIFMGEDGNLKICPFVEWEFERVDEVLLWGSLSVIYGNHFFGFGVDAERPV
jgi:hypothetical protein